MNSRVLFLFSVLLSLSFVQIHSISQKTEWKGTLDEINGIKVISNPEEPIYGELKFELVDDLRIGNDLDDNYLFVRIRGVSVDEQRNIYITDWGNFRIQKFNWNGEYIQTFGRDGEGPGEFRWLMQMCLDEPSGYIYVKDGGLKIEKFNGAMHLTPVATRYSMPRYGGLSKLIAGV